MSGLAGTSPVRFPLPQKTTQAASNHFLCLVMTVAHWQSFTGGSWWLMGTVSLAVRFTPFRHSLIADIVIEEHIPFVARRGLALFSPISIANFAVRSDLISCSGISSMTSPVAGSQNLAASSNRRCCSLILALWYACSSMPSLSQPN